MKDLKKDYNFDEQVKLISAKKEAEQVLRGMTNYRFDCISLMNKIIDQRHFKHTTTASEFSKLFRDMTALNRKLFILRKMIKDFKVARAKIMAAKKKEKNEST